MKKLVHILAGLALVAVLANHDVMAQENLKVGGQLGYDLDSEELYLGPHAVFDLPLQIGDVTLQGNPEFSYYLVDNPEGVSSSFWLLTLNALYPLNLEFADTYVGAGLAITHWSVSYDEIDFFSKGSGVILTDFEESSTDIGLHAKFGAGFGSGSFQPGAEVGFIASDSSWLYLQGFVRFAI